MKNRKPFIFILIGIIGAFIFITYAYQKVKMEMKSDVGNKLEVLDVGSIARHPQIIDFTRYFGKTDKFPELTEMGYDIRSTDLSDIDLTNELDKLLYATYDSQTIWPAHLPEGFQPDKCMELYKNPGLNIRSLHKKGITGKGVGIAIIDQPLLMDHVEYKNQLKYYIERDSVQSQPASMHGPGVASIAVGKTVGVAPDADLYYIAEDFIKVGENHGLLAESINQVLDLNKSLPYENRIRVISISWGAEKKGTAGYDKLMEAYARAKVEGVIVLTTSISTRENMVFLGLDKVPLSDPDDFNTYINKLYFSDKKTYKISVPMNLRCVASPTGIEDYTVYAEGGMSWATPYVAGLYALACQVKPDITYEEFWKLAAETARSGKGVKDGKAYEADYIVDPVVLMDTISNTKVSE